MNMYVLSTLSAVLGSAVVSLGMVLQKRGVAWLRPGQPRDAAFRRDRAIWIWGFVLNNLLVVFYFFALKALSPSVVGAMMGLNLLFTNLFSAFIVKEPLSRRVVAFSVVMVGFIVMANLAAPEAVEGQSVPLGLVLAFFAFPFALAAAALPLRRLAGLGKDDYATFFAAAAGCLEGVVIVLVKAMETERGNDVLGYLTTPYLYMYAAATVAVISFMQVAYSHGKITRVAPVLWGAQIAYPVLITYVAFRAPVVPLQLAAFVGIVLCVVVIQTKR